MKVEVYKYRARAAPVKQMYVLAGNQSSTGIDWIPTLEQVEKILAALEDEVALDNPTLPKISAQGLRDYAASFNEVLHDANVKENRRPYLMAAVLLGLWRWHRANDPKAELRFQPDTFVEDLHGSCRKAFAVAGKGDLGEKLIKELSPDKPKEAAALMRIYKDLEGMRLIDAATDVDYLGQFYETFFRYTGSEKSMGQFFTPRWLTDLMASMVPITKETVVFDPCCGTGGFLIAAASAAQRAGGMSWEDTVKVMAENGCLLGIEVEGQTAALCVTNMIIRGDGKSGIRSASCLDSELADYPYELVDLLLTNPPFNKKKKAGDGNSDERGTLAIVKKGMAAVKPGGHYLSVLPDVILRGSKDYLKWRHETLKDWDLLAVVMLPQTVFEPYASTGTNVVLLRRKSTPEINTQPPRIPYIRLHGLSTNDDTSHPAFEAGVAWNKPGGEIAPGSIAKAVDWAKQYLAYSGLSVPPPLIPDADKPFVAFAPVDPDDWTVSANLPHHIPTVEAARRRALEIARNLIGLRVDYHAELKEVEGNGPAPEQKSPAEFLLVEANNSAFARKLKGQLKVREKDRITEDMIPADMWLALRSSTLENGKLGTGQSIVITGAYFDNGFGGFYDLETAGYEKYTERVLKPPFITVSHKGSPGHSNVQLWPCAVGQNSLVLVPPKNVVQEFADEAAQNKGKPKGQHSNKAFARMLVAAAYIDLILPQRFRFDCVLPVEVLRSIPFENLLASFPPAEIDRVERGVNKCLGIVDEVIELQENIVFP